MKHFYVINEDINSKKFVPYDVMPYLLECYDKAEHKPITFKEFKTFIENKSRYMWWSRCEYEIVLQSWPTGKIEKKIDIYYQLMMNIDIVTETLISNINETKQ